MRYKITLIPGDGIGPEVTEAARRCIEATGVKIGWELRRAGESVLREAGLGAENISKEVKKYIEDFAKK